MLRAILLFTILWQSIYADKIGERMEKSSILMDRPYYTVRIGAVNVNIVVTLNGERVFADFTTWQQFLELPVNHLMTSGENRLEVKLLSYEEEEFKIKPKAQAFVALRVKRAGDYSSKPLLITEISYDKGDINAASEGSYDSKEGMKRSNAGDVKISKLEQKRIDGIWTGERVKGLWFTQTVTLQTPFPRWKFLDSQKLYDGNFMLDVDDDEYEELKKRKDIQELYALIDKIQKRLQAKDTDWVADLFKERNEESDIAFYKERGYYDRTIRKGLKELVNDPEYEIFIPKDPPFYISEGGRTIMIRSSISYNRKKGRGNQRYDILFRRENGKWILTR